MSYIDGFVLPVPKSRLEEYRQLCELACQIWMDHGALEYMEYIAEDIPDGEVTSFPMSVALGEGEMVCFSYIRYASREHRDAVMKNVKADERMRQCMNPEGLPFDGQRMMWGGFTSLVSSEDSR